MENLDVARRLAGVEDRARADAMIDRLALGAYAGRRAARCRSATCSGWPSRAPCCTRPELLILDEPANGLDPAGVIEIRDLLRDLAQHEGVTVFMSSHILGEVDLLADRIGIVHRGRLVEELDSDALEQQARPTAGSRCSGSVGPRPPPGGRPDAAAARRRTTRTPRPDGARGTGEGRRDPGVGRGAADAPGDRAGIARGALHATHQRRSGGRVTASARRSRPSSSRAAAHACRGASPSGSRSLRW